MKFYRNKYTTEADSSHGYTFHTSLRAAELARKEFRARFISGGIEADVATETIDVIPTREGIRHALNCYASHNDNG